GKEVGKGVRAVKNKGGCANGKSVKKTRFSKRLNAFGDQNANDDWNDDINVIEPSSPIGENENIMYDAGDSSQPSGHGHVMAFDEKEGMVTFEKDDEKITFKMPHKMEASNRIDFKDINTDSILPFVLGSNDDRGKTYYSDSLTLGPEYREEESIRKEIHHLMKLEREAKRHKEEVTKTHLLEDKQIPSVVVFDEVFSIWKAFEGNARDLGSFGEETDKTTDLHQHLSRLCSQQLKTASHITRDAVTFHTKTTSQDLKTASECTTQPII
ncbi:hypothetical protein Tco_0829822, partial [Tanacetum coccineum]